MRTISAKEARQQFAQLLNEVYFGHKKILITRSGKPLVVVMSIKEYDEKIKKK